MPAPSTLLLWGLPCSYALAALLASLLPRRQWALAQLAAGIGLGCTLLAAGVVLATPGSGVDVAEHLVALLVGVLAWVILRYSQDYLAGEAGQARYLQAMLFTLTAVGMVVLATHLAVLVLAWTATSLGLHRLLTFYPERSAAQVAAHKKFLVSRLAELCLLVALGLIYHELGSLWLDELIAAARSPGSHPSLHAAAVLIALAVMLKSAQLPLHGWLIQVMEAPTPISALLHAGIINLGGLVVIRLAPVFDAAPLAQALLIACGSVTAVLASLVMMTRISVKVRLAWSTCAQMGFMLLECGLGLYELALLHLLAHSLYKAHAFLSAGEAVSLARHRALLPQGLKAGRAAWWRRVLALPLALALVTGMSALAGQWLPASALPPVAVMLVGIGLAPLLWPTPGATRHNLLAAIGLSGLYLLWHALFAGLLPGAQGPGLLASAWVALSFGALYFVQAWLKSYPQGRLSAWLYPKAFGGFYLDERYTRLSFRLWPAPTTTPPAAAPMATSPASAVP